MKTMTREKRKYPVGLLSEVATELGVSRMTVQNALNGRKTPTTYKVLALINEKMAKYKEIEKELQEN